MRDSRTRREPTRFVSKEGRPSRARRSLLAGITVAVVWGLGATSAVSTYAATTPELTLEPPIAISTVAATLRGQVNPEGEATTYQFEYGTTTAYGMAIPIQPASVAPGVSPAAVDQRVSGLVPDTTYHYRLVATNASGTTDGEDATFATYPAEEVASECPNEDRRKEQYVTLLPDCRAYEMVSPLDKNGASVEGAGETTFSSASGEAVTFAARAGFGQTTGSGILGLTQYLAAREATGWQVHGITPTPPPESLQILAGYTVAAGFSESLSSAIVEGLALPGVPDAIENGVNQYLENTSTGKLVTITTPLGSEREFPNPLELAGAIRGYTPTLETIAFETSANLLPEATGYEPKLYVWQDGTLTLPEVLPDGTLAAAATAATPAMAERSDISADGARVLFVATPPGASQPQLYMRINGQRTVWISRSEASAPIEWPSGVSFAAMSADGTKVAFLSKSPLIDGDPGGRGVGLYLYTDGPEPEAESNLTFVGRIENRGVPAGGVVTAMSEDGTHIVFYAKANGGFPLTGTYIWDAHNGSRMLAATSRNLQAQTTRISSTGARIAFIAGEQLTSQPLGVEPSGVNRQGEPDMAMYEYESATGELKCISCLPTESPTSSDATVEPAATNAGAKAILAIPVRFTADDGRFVFFSTADPLVSRDTNGREDVYEYDTVSGKVHLLSSGVGDAGSWFASASKSGGDAFFVTAEKLVGGDSDTLVDLYDARTDGGFLETQYGGTTCAGDECQAIPTAPPAFDTANGFSGNGNLRPASSKPGASRNRVRRRLQACALRRNRRQRLICGARVRRAAHLPLTRAERSILALARCGRLKPAARRRTCRKRSHVESAGNRQSTRYLTRNVNRDQRPRGGR